MRIYKKFEVTEYVYASPRVPFFLDGKRIVQISDLHGRMYGENHSLLLAAVKKAEPTFVFITGDLIDCEWEDREIHRSLLKSLYALYGENVFFVHGNHEHCCRSYKAITDGIISLGVTLLINDYIPFPDYCILGLDSEYLIDKKIISAAERIKKSGKFVLALSHKPEQIKFYSSLPIDLLFSGHAHGGQIRIGDRGLYAPNQGIFPEYTAGIYKSGNFTEIVSRGLGGKMPLRINNPPELVVCTLKKT